MKRILLICLFSSNFLLAQEPKGTIGYNTKQDGNFEVYSMDANGANIKNLSQNAKIDYGLCWSKNGQKIYFYTNRDGNEEIYSMDSDGSNQTNITNHISKDRIPEISSNGKQLAFQSDRDHKNGEIYIQNTKDNSVIRLTNNEWYEESPCFSKDSKKLLFTRQLETKKDSIVETNGEIFIIDLTNKKETQLTHRKGFDSGAKFSPNEKKIAFYGKDETTKNYDLFIMNSDGSNIINLTNDATEDYSPVWSPDGNWLAFTRGDSKNYDVWIINIRTNEMRRLTTHTARDENPFWKK